MLRNAPCRPPTLGGPHAAREEAPDRTTPPHLLGGGDARAASSMLLTGRAASLQLAPPLQPEGARSTSTSASSAAAHSSPTDTADLARAAPIAGGGPAAESPEVIADAASPPRRLSVTMSSILDETAGPATPRIPLPALSPHDTGTPLTLDLSFPPTTFPPPPSDPHALADHGPACTRQTTTPRLLGPLLGPSPGFVLRLILLHAVRTIASSPACTSSPAANAARTGSQAGRTLWAAPLLTWTSSRAGRLMTCGSRRCSSDGVDGFGAPNATSHSMGRRAAPSARCTTLSCARSGSRRAWSSCRRSGGLTSSRPTSSGTLQRSWLASSSTPGGNS